MIHVICTDISGLDEAAWQRMRSGASPERRARADRCRRREDALRCLMGEVLLRHALGTDRYALEILPGGKPRVAGRKDFHYNLSHAGPWVAIAWGDSPVGIDVEQGRRRADARGIAARFFTREEQALLDRDPDSFFRIWTAKESIIKYRGTGLKDLAGADSQNPGPGLCLTARRLSDGSYLTLCAGDADVRFSFSTWDAFV